MIIGSNMHQTVNRVGGIEGSKKRITIKNYLDKINDIRRLGYKQIELYIGPLFLALSEDKIKTLMVELVNYKKQHNLIYSVHLPFWWLNYSCPNEEIRIASVKEIKRSIKLSKCLNPKQYVSHAFEDITMRADEAIAPIEVKEIAYDEIFRQTETSLSEILEEIEDTTKFCIENLLNSNMDWILKLQKKFNTSITYDIGHKYMTDQEIIGFLRKYHTIIASIHACNVKIEKYNHINPQLCAMSDHFELNSGVIDFTKVLSTLKEINFKGSFIVEVNNHMQAISSANFLKEHGYL